MVKDEGRRSLVYVDDSERSEVQRAPRRTERPLKSFVLSPSEAVRRLSPAKHASAEDGREDSTLTGAHTPSLHTYTNLTS